MMRRTSLAPPGSGQPKRPGVDCPNCGAVLSVHEGVRTCSGGCGHREVVPS